jgi:hypothetical protein
MLCVGMLNLVGVFGDEGAVAPGPGVEAVGGVDQEVVFAASEPAPGDPEPAEAPAEEEDACPADTFRIGERYPAGREIYCLHSEEAVRHGPFVAWHDNGVQKARGQYRMGKRHGHWVKYDEQGRMQVEADFADDQKHGRVRVYGADGSLQSESLWDHGRRTG